MSQKEWPEECPVREILKQISAVLTLLQKVLDHCEHCPFFKEEKK